MISDRTIGIVGVGMVGSAMLQSFTECGVKVIAYDKFRPGFTDEDVDFQALADTEMIFVSVPTLTDKDGEQDLVPLFDVLERIARMKYKGIVVSKCTTLPSTTQFFADLFPYLKIVHCPEFLRAANAYEDFKFQKASMVSGAESSTLEVAEFLRELFPNLTIRRFASYATTEILKYTNNCFLPVKISFLNEVATICEAHGVVYSEMIEALSLLGRIGETDLRVPGPDGRRGWGGFCFPKDTKAWSHHMRRRGLPTDTLDGAIESNDKIRNKDAK
jgi:UDPglucose 6-dehydrogenase